YTYRKGRNGKLTTKGTKEEQGKHGGAQPRAAVPHGSGRAAQRKNLTFRPATAMYWHCTYSQSIRSSNHANVNRFWATSEVVPWSFALNIPPRRPRKSGFALLQLNISHSGCIRHFHCLGVSAGHECLKTEQTALSDQHSVPKPSVYQVVQIGARWADGNGKLGEINSGVDSAKSFKFGVGVRGSPGGNSNVNRDSWDQGKRQALKRESATLAWMN